jgi:hypothetical protein
VHGEAGAQQHDRHEYEQRAELVAGVDARRDRRPVGRQPVLRERPRHDRRGAEHARRQRGGRPQPQRHDEEPDRDGDHERDERAARVGQHQAHEQ